MKWGAVFDAGMSDADQCDIDGASSDRHVRKIFGAGAAPFM
ncbi:hypothetical protein OH687_36275 [Burkholderia anthina]|nr:hypothetical protein OH687_36275 [Burkholderia anthina]